MFKDMNKFPLHSYMLCIQSWRMLRQRFRSMEAIFKGGGVVKKKGGGEITCIYHLIPMLSLKLKLVQKYAEILKKMLRKPKNWSKRPPMIFFSFFYSSPIWEGLYPYV